MSSLSWLSAEVTNRAGAFHSLCPTFHNQLWMQVALSCRAQQAVMTSVSTEFNRQRKSHKRLQQQSIHLKNEMKLRFLPQQMSVHLTPEGSRWSWSVAPWNLTFLKMLFHQCSLTCFLNRLNAQSYTEVRVILWILEMHQHVLMSTCTWMD